MTETEGFGAPRARERAGRSVGRGRHEQCVVSVGPRYLRECPATRLDGITVTSGWCLLSGAAFAWAGWIGSRSAPAVAGYVLAFDLSTTTQRTVVVSALALLQGVAVGLVQAAALRPWKGRVWLLAWPLTSGILWGVSAASVSVIWAILPAVLAEVPYAHFIARCICTGLAIAGGVMLIVPGRWRPEWISWFGWSAVVWTLGSSIGTAGALWLVARTAWTGYWFSSFDLFVVVRWGFLGICVGAVLPLRLRRGGVGGWQRGPAPANPKAI